MKNNHPNYNMFWSRLGSERGVTLVELLMGLVVMGIVSTATYASYQVCQRTLNTDRQVMEIQQQLRGAFQHMEGQIRVAGFGSTSTTPLGVADVQRYTIPDDNDTAALSTAATASPALSLTMNLTGAALPTTVSFYLYDDGADNLSDLCVSNVAPGAAISGAATRELVAENIETIDFAFAVDQDENNILDSGPDANGDGIPESFNTTGASLNDIPLWLVDTDNDNILDAVIPEGGGTPVALTTITGYPTTTVALEDIEVVRIWMLVRTHPALEVKMTDMGTFQVGRFLIDPDSIDGQAIFRRRMLTANVRGMNF